MGYKIKIKRNKNHISITIIFWQNYICTKLNVKTQSEQKKKGLDSLKAQITSDSSEITLQAMETYHLRYKLNF